MAARAARAVVSATVNGSDALRRTLLDAAPKKLRAAAKSAAGKAGRIVAKEAKSHVPTRSGATKKAIGSKVAARKKVGGWVAIVGPRRDNETAISQSVAAVAAGKRKRSIKRRFARTVAYMGRRIRVDPVKYAHLIEFGRKAITPTKKKALSFTDRPGLVKRVKPAAPKPFLGPAYRASEQRVKDVVELTLTEAVRKLGGKA